MRILIVTTQVPLVGISLAIDMNNEDELYFNGKARVENNYLALP